MRLHVGVSPRSRLRRHMVRYHFGPPFHDPYRELVPPVEWVPYFELKRPALILHRRMVQLGLWIEELYLLHALWRDALAGRY